MDNLIDAVIHTNINFIKDIIIKNNLELLLSYGYDPSPTGLNLAIRNGLPINYDIDSRYLINM